MTLRALSPHVWVSGQIGPDDVLEAKALGVERIVNNRPDGEEPGQPRSDQVAAWAAEAGLVYHWLPIRGLPSRDNVSETARLLADGRPALLFCRSGMRSAATWAMARAATGMMTPDEARAAARAAGFDLSGVPL